MYSTKASPPRTLPLLLCTPSEFRYFYLEFYHQQGQNKTPSKNNKTTTALYLEFVKLQFAGDLRIGSSC